MIYQLTSRGIMVTKIGEAVVSTRKNVQIGKSRVYMSGDCSMFMSIVLVKQA